MRIDVKTCRTLHGIRPEIPTDGFRLHICMHSRGQDRIDI